MHKARGRAARSNLSDSPRADRANGKGGREGRKMPPLPPSDFGNCSFRKYTSFLEITNCSFLFYNYETQKRSQKKNLAYRATNFLFPLKRSHEKKH